MLFICHNKNKQIRRCRKYNKKCIKNCMKQKPNDLEYLAGKQNRQNRNIKTVKKLKIYKLTEMQLSHKNRYK